MTPSEQLANSRSCFCLRALPAALYLAAYVNYVGDHAQSCTGEHSVQLEVDFADKLSCESGQRSLPLLQNSLI